MMLRWLADWLIARARRTPYWHLHHADGSLYMERFWLRPYSEDRRRFAVRVHHLASRDVDRELHDHPWSFVSVVLKGAYLEARPLRAEPDFADHGERCRLVVRKAGSIAFRRATDRHRIVEVLPNTWTLFITGPKRQEWGFYTPAGKVHWRDYEKGKIDEQAQQGQKQQATADAQGAVLRAGPEMRGGKRPGAGRKLSVEK